MVRLLLETATDVCSVALARDGKILAEQTATEPHLHASHLTLFIQEVMQQADTKLTELSEVVLSDGPGSYTSLRVGAATAKGLCLALPGLSLRVVPTLAALMLAAKPHSEATLAVINSRRGEVYGQFFMPEGARPQVQSEVFGKQGLGHLDPLFLGPQNIRLTEPDWLDRLTAAAQTAYFRVCGPGQQRVWDHLPNNDGEVLGFAGPEHCSAIHLLAPAA
ncbi:MAG: tRNA (adenosine(37)-N6)-threonylcarbamoyltransferase complex dimerization subunit type 1 TsaB, partial [Bacteroidota bacterium]